MRARNRSGAPAHRAITDNATLYLCRRGLRWVVVIQTPHFVGAVPFQHRGRDGHDARSGLLTTARLACPAAVITTDRILIAEHCEWRVEVRGVEERAGALGLALRRALSGDSTNDGGAPTPMIGPRCRRGLGSRDSGRPPGF
jgi:hypothetical protein